MRVISRKRLEDFWMEHPNAETPLKTWFQVISSNPFKSFAELRETFGSADIFKHCTIFNISGNSLRLIAATHYKSQIIFIRNILTHPDYDKEKWKNQAFHHKKVAAA